MKILFETRFSFFGQSGWRSPASKDPDALFDPARLDARLDMFERYTLASLACQTDTDFDHAVLSSAGLPDIFKKRLETLCHDLLGDRVSVLYKNPMHAGHAFRKYVKRTYRSENHVAQVVLDDDDAVSLDFVMALRYQANSIICDPMNTDSATFISFPRGFSMGLDDGKPAWLSPRNVPFTNLGLAMVSSPLLRKNPYLTSHRKIGERHASYVVGANRPFYLRAIHEQNDSRAIANDAHLDAIQIAETYKYFPFLKDQFESAIRRVA